MTARSTVSNSSIPMLLVLAIFFSVGLALSGYASASSARSSDSKATNCGTIFARNYFNGKDVRISVVRHADC